MKIKRDGMIRVPGAEMGDVTERKRLHYPDNRRHG
jgi:hypothetical protein